MRVRFTLASIGEIDCRAIVRNRLEVQGVGVELLALFSISSWPMSWPRRPRIGRLLKVETTLGERITGF